MSASVACVYDVGVGGGRKVRGRERTALCLSAGTKKKNRKQIQGTAFTSTEGRAAVKTCSRLADDSARFGDGRLNSHTSESTHKAGCESNTGAVWYQTLEMTEASKTQPNRENMFFREHGKFSCSFPQGAASWMCIATLKLCAYSQAR